MLRSFLLLLSLLVAGPLPAAQAGADARADAAAAASTTASTTASTGAGAGAGAGVRLAIVRTAGLHVREGLVYAGGSFGKQVENAFSAILVRHGDDVMLFDSGLGAQVAAQYRADMPWWQRPFFRYEDPVLPVARQLAGRGLPPVSRIFLSHSHWDHASGLADFPGAQVWAAREEIGVAAHPCGGVGGAWPSQLAVPGLKWRELRFAPAPYRGFGRSLDLYGDGTLVLVPLSGHTPGSVGLFATTASGRRYFFVGDAVWNADALRGESPKFWAARLLVDADAGATQRVIGQIHRAQQADPGLVVVPAHDGRVQSALGYFPKWLP